MIGFPREEARDLAEDRGIDPEDMLYCQECGRTVVRKQRDGNPGFKDKIFCTCDSVGYPMVPVVDPSSTEEDR